MQGTNVLLVSLRGKDGGCTLIPQTCLTPQQTDYEVDLESCTATPRYELLLSRLSRLEELVASVTGNRSVSAGADNLALSSCLSEIANNTDSLLELFNQISGQTEFLVDAANSSLTSCALSDLF